MQKCCNEVICGVCCHTACPPFFVVQTLRPFALLMLQKMMQLQHLVFVQVLVQKKSKPMQLVQVENLPPSPPEELL